MTPRLPSEAPEYHSRNLSPVSPRPVHLPEPSKIPVLQNQMDPLLNDTATYIGHQTVPGLATTANYSTVPASDQASSSPYADNDNDLANGQITETGNEADGGGNDDYAMSLDFDDEDESEEQHVSTTTQDPLSTNHRGTISNQEVSHTISASLQSDPSPDTSVPAFAQPEPLTNAPSFSHPFPNATAPGFDIAEATNATISNPVTSEAQEEDAHAEPSEGEATVVNNGGFDYQTLLDNLSTSIATVPSVETHAAPAALSASIAPNVSSGNVPSPTTALPPHANLPPRPPPQAKPATHPNYAPGDDIRSYHPHNQTPNVSPTFSSQPSNSFRPPPHGLPPPMAAAGAPGTAPAANALPPPPLATFQQPPLATLQQQQQQQQQSPSAIQNIRQSQKFERTITRSVNSQDDDDDQQPWGPEVQAKYDRFLHDERTYVTEGQWDKFPANSRLFIGNLPTEKVTKRDLFHIFHKHGKLAQVSIKQAYGFVQFLDSGACHRALQDEQGMAVRGRKMHLEISKPQKNSRNNTDGAGTKALLNRRSRSPDYTRGGPAGAGTQLRGDRYVGERDRAYDSRGAAPSRDRDYRDAPVRAREEYRPIRSPSPRGFRGRDEYRGGRDRDRSWDRYDGRRRSRSRSPYNRGGGGSRYRSRSPRGRDGDDEADLLLPRRESRDVPELQVIVMDDIDRNFISFVERAFRDRGVRTDVLYLKPRLSLEAVLKRQILEGVQAVTKLDRQSQLTGKIPLQVFDRRGGADNVRFDEYDNLDSTIAAELVVRAKQTHGAPPPVQYALPPAPSYGASHYAQPAPPQPQPPPQAAAPPNLANLITSLDGPTLQKLLGAMQQPQSAQQTPMPQHLQHQQHQQPPPHVTPGLSADLASLLSGAARQQPQAQPYQQQQHHLQQQPPTNPYAALASNPQIAGNPTLASLLAGAVNRPQQQQQSQQVQPAQNVQNIMEQLARWKQ
ncbi:MAG: hypothetical protein M1812_001015 [Candelaria pacifica]|nr:MAG: hypothetical protein M1812_001015 [Candelaria pacifica]